jgi:hypothetical protein
MIDLNQIAFILTIIAFSLAIWQTRIALQEASRQRKEASRQREEARHQTEKLADISNALSTRYIGDKFSEFLPEIERVINKVNKELLILAVNPIMGDFSAPKECLAVRHSVDNVFESSPDVTVSCIFGNSAVRRKLFEEQFDEARKDWNYWRSKPEIDQKLKNYLKKFDIDIEELTFERFCDLGESRKVEALKTTYNRAKVIEIDFLSPVYMWIADDKEAVFIFRTTEPTYQAAAFSTSDQRLIIALGHIYQEYLKLSQKQNNNSNFNK